MDPKTSDESCERDQLCYQQNFEQFRSLNQLMWQVPVIAMTLTGGLWFGAAKTTELKGARYALLILAALGDVGLIVVLTRTRFVMHQYLEKLRAFHISGFVSATGTRLLEHDDIVPWTFTGLLALSAAISMAIIVLM